MIIENIKHTKELLDKRMGECYKLGDNTSTVSLKDKVMAENKTEVFGEQIYDLFARLLNSPSNRAVLDSIRGEYGLLWFLLQADGPVPVGQLAEHLQVVPGRMTDILKNLEKKGFVSREKSSEDRRVVYVKLLDAGREEVNRKRAQIREQYHGLGDIFNEQEARELLRLLNMLLTYSK